MLASCKQKPDETVSDFFTRFEEAFHDYSGQSLTDDTGRHLFVDKYVANLLPEIAKRLKSSESSWATATPASLLTMAQYYERQELEAKESVDKKAKELKTKVMLAQVRGTQSRGYDRGRRGGGNASYGRTDIAEDQCAYCKEFGHWADDCPVLREQRSQRGRGGGRSRGSYSGARGSGGDRGRFEERGRGQDERNTFDRRNQYQISEGENVEHQDYVHA